MSPQGHLGDRKAPYATARSLREFLERIRTISVPGRVDRRFLQRLGVARSNEWALLSALKFLGIVDEAGLPTQLYRELQSSAWKSSLRRTIRSAYAPLLELGGETMSADELRNYFRVEYSPSQAENAARFFREILRLAGSDAAAAEEPLPRPAGPSRPPDRPPDRDQTVTVEPGRGERILALKERVLATLPPPRDDWTAEQYREIYSLVIEILRNLDTTP